MRPEEHPYAVVAPFLRGLEQDTMVELSIYRYVPQSRDDERRLLHRRVSDFDWHWVEQVISSLRPGEELAFHSRVYARGRCVHLPMLDFVESSSVNAIAALGSGNGPDIRDWALFSSGRSFHGYFLRLLTQEQWVSFMGDLLLLNPPQGASVSDARWIGHRLRAGYGALRWSANTKQYLQLPVLVRRISEEAVHAQPALDSQAVGT